MTRRAGIAALFVPLCLVVMVVAASAQPTVQEIVVAAKPAVVLVTARVDADVMLTCGAGQVTVNATPFVETGTGWFVDGRGWLITNAHVVDPAHTLPPWVQEELRKSAVERACVDPVLAQRGLMRGQRADLEAELRRRADPARAVVKPTPSVTIMMSNGKTLAAEVKKFSAPLRLDAGGKALAESGRDLALLRVPSGAYPALGLNDEIPRIGSELHIIGFPGVVLSHELLGKSAAVEASVTNGIVSGFKQDALGQDVIQSDAAAAHGNSGGPAVGAGGAVAGVLTFVSLSPTGGNVVQGFNFLIPARDVRKFLAGTDVAMPTGGAFDAAWRAGVHDLFQGRYGAAVARIEEANTLLSGLPDVKRALNDAKNPPPRPFPWVWVTLALALVSGAGYGGYLYRRWQRNRFRIPASEVAKLIDGGHAPLVLDVRHGDTEKPGTLRIPGSVRLSEETLAHGGVPEGIAKEQPVVAFCT